MNTLYNMFKAYGKQTDRTAYSLCGIEIEFYSMSKTYQVNL